MSTQPVDATVDSQPHGTLPRYRRGCHCQPCTAANTRYHKGWRASRDTPAEHGYDTLGRRRSPHAAARVAYTLTPKAEAALAGCWVGSTLAGYAAPGPDGA